MDVISFAVGGSPYIWMATDILNILTGVFIFAIFVCKPKVSKLINAKFPFLQRFSVQSFVEKISITGRRISTDNTGTEDISSQDVKEGYDKDINNLCQQK